MQEIYFIYPKQEDDMQFTDAEVDARIDYRTGEILDDLEYETVDYFHHSLFAEDEWFKEYSEPCSSLAWAAQVEQHDRRLMRTVNNFRHVYGGELVRNKLEGTREVTNKKQAQIVEQLIELVQLKNMIVMQQQELAEELGVNRANLMRTLAHASGTIRVSTERNGMNRGDIRVEINPAYVYRWYTPRNSSLPVSFMQEVAIKNWLHSGLFR